MIAIVIGLIFLGMTLAVPFAFLAFMRINKARAEAKSILAKGKVDDTKRVDVILKLLSVSKDHESAHLWKELNALREKIGKVA